MDHSHEWTDEQIAKLTVKMHEVYAQAANEMQDKLEEWMKDYDKQRKAWEKAVIAGVRTQKEFDDWLSDRAMERTWQTNMINRLASDAVNADARCRQMINDELPTIYAENANRQAFEIDRACGFDTNFTLYNQDSVRFLMTDPKIYPSVDVAKDMAWNQQKFASAITQSVLQGESIPHAARRLRSVFAMDERAATMAARTSITFVESRGRQSSMLRAKSLGIPIKQMWRANLDGRTRLAHRQADGQMVDVGEKFELDGNKMTGPGDPEAPGYLIYNCRCRVLGKVQIDGLPEEVTRRYNRLPKDVTYDDWKRGIYRTHPDHTETKSSKKERGVS